MSYEWAVIALLLVVGGLAFLVYLPLLAYITAKMATLGYLRARRFFNRGSEPPTR